MLKCDGSSEGKNFCPEYIANTVADIDFTYLYKSGVKALLIDLDGTVVNRSKYKVPKSITKALEMQPLEVYIATNRPESRDLKNLKKLLHARGVVYPRGIWGKPSKRYFLRALSILNLRPDQVAMIGDRYIQDVYGSKKAGLHSILVRKLDRPVN
jgi:hypothetical protein